MVKCIVPASSYSVNIIYFEEDIQNGMLCSLILLLDNLVNMRHQPIQYLYFGLIALF